MTKKNYKIIIATGGTGGHIFPAYSLAKHFIDKNFSVELISDKRGLKYIKNYNKIKITQIPSSTIFKKNARLRDLKKGITYLVFNDRR